MWASSRSSLIAPPGWGLRGRADPRHDLDFGAILGATQGAKPSVVQIRADDVTPDASGAQVVRALRQLAAELEQLALLTIDATRTRMRLLPLRPYA